MHVVVDAIREIEGCAAAAYTRAMSTNLLQKDVEQLVLAVLARAGYEKRRLESETGMHIGS